MKRLDRYIMRTVFTHTSLVLMVLLGLYFFSTLIKEMGFVGKGAYDNKDAVVFSLMLLPRQVYELFPLVALIGSMLGLGALASHSELTVMRAAGVSVRRLTVSVLKAGLVMILLVTALGEMVAPELEKEASTMRLKAMARSITLNTGDRLWAKDGESFVAIRRLEPDGQAHGVQLYRLNEQRLSEIAVARSARYRNGEWLLSEVQRTRFDGDGVVTEHVDSLAWSSRLAPEIINIASMKPENLAIWELSSLVDFMRENGLSSQRYEVAMWVRLFVPLATAGMILLALPFVFGSMRAVGVGARVMVGAMIGIVFYIANNVISRMGLLYDIPPLLSAALPTLLVFVAWLLLMRRAS
ncbi:MAG: LPS export ABC transporter permease LptG [Pseudomonadota bacterium]